MNALVGWASHLVAAQSVAGVVRDPKSLFALLVAALFVMYGLSVGRTRAIISLLSIYVGYMLTVLFPYTAWVADRAPTGLRPFLPLVLFFVLYGIVFLLISHSIRKTRMSLGEISVLQVLLITAVQLGLLASVAGSLVPAITAATAPEPLRTIIAGQRALWIWAAASLLLLPLMKARRRG